MESTVSQQSDLQVRSEKPFDLWFVWLLSFGGMILAFPFYSYMVFGLDFDRQRIADIFSIHVTAAYWVGILGAFLPLPKLRHWSSFRRLQTVCLTFLIVSYATHLSWELIWLILHDQIAMASNSMWAYSWWAYIDGGDLRFLNPTTSFLMMEVLSVINASIGITGLVLLWRSKFKNPLGTLMCMSTAVTHTVLTWYYYGSEFMTGLESVNTASFVDLWIQFVLLNAPWLVFPWFVLFWGWRLLKEQFYYEYKMHQ